MYGGEAVLDEARRQLPQRSLISAALDDLEWLATHLKRDHPEVRLGFDLSDMSGYAYYSGTRFAIYGAGSSDALARGGRYDEVGAVFGRRPSRSGLQPRPEAVGRACAGAGRQRCRRARALG